MSRARLNYWIDVVMGAAFVISAISGLVFLLPAGMLSSDASGTLGVAYRVWDVLHTWGSLAMIAGVGGHLLLHTKWIVAMTKKVLVPAAGAGSADLGRRKVVKLGGALGLGALAAAAAGLLGLRAALGADDGGAEDANAASPAYGEQELCVACPHGLVNDPYPGRCRRYVDRDGDRICDLSVPEVCG